jgi:DNA-binding NtrC family response regulator
MDELKTVEQIRRQDREVPLLLITRNSSEARVIAALRAGVTDYFKWPVSYEELIASVNRNLSYHKRSLSETGIDQPMIGDSAQMQEIKAYLLKVAATDSTVFITGETGTGKELAAELIHRNSSRHKKPFVCINCAALPESLIESEMFGYERGAFTGAIASKRGKFELAVGGTVFLDEIGDMSLYAQAKILRTIERKEVYRLGGNGRIPVDVRVTAATNQDPERLVAEGKFRKDLYYRLNVARVNLPLLKNVLEATFINLPSRKIAFMDLPNLFRMRLKETEGLTKSERDRMLSALFATNWNKSKAAQKLHWSRMTLYRKIAKYHISTSNKY